MNVLKKMIPASLRTRIRLALEAGDRYVCPFCGYHAKALGLSGKDLQVLREKQVVGGGFRNSECYQCGSSDRERLVYFYLRDYIHILDQATRLRVLHVAPEKHLVKALLAAKNLDYVCGDKFTEGYHYAPHVQEMDLLDLHFPDGSFDLVICNHVLEHIPDDLAAMCEVFRVLKPGGRALLQVPLSRNSAQTIEDFSVNTKEERERRFGQFDHVRIFGQDYPDRLARAGFKVERLNISNKPEYAKGGLNPLEDIFVAHKP
jgi:SAM-dependent methyltransferase